ncbi:MAG: DNA primase [Aquabacterium sp.]|uniref:DNA primase n=1 Tax=Aquabacterium sp. TaxID=1872578 RepID=UPI001B777F26|nr:DNA primase [Aquabacterium sp.]MBP7131267.1 DNA primase [Aquabacterium sp.]MBP9062417.1 DNA primase [Aquabacterium sp.]
MIPPSFIQDLLARTDVADIVGRYVTLKKAGINYKGLCPFHGEKTPSFIVSPSRQTYHCFGCGVHGNALGFLMEYGGLGFVDAIKDLAQIQGMQVPDEDISPQERERQKQVKEKQTSLTDVMATAAQHWKQQLKQNQRAIDYLKGRGLSGQIAARFGLGYAPDSWRGLASAFPKYDDPLLVESGLVISHEPQDGETESKRYDRFRDRIMFPIRNPQGQVIGFGGRVLDKGEPKYLNSPETPVFIKGRELYGLFEGRSALRNKGYAIVTEGYMDVVALAQWGYGNAVATLGTACTADHAHKLFRFTDQVVFSFDGDAAGRRAAGRALEAVLPHATDTRRISFLFLPAEHDPDSYIREFGPEAFEACIKKAVPLSRQVLEHASADCDLDSAEGRARLLVQAIPLIAQFPDGALKGLIADDLAQMARTSPDEVRRRIAEQPLPGSRSAGHSPRPGAERARGVEGGPPPFEQDEGAAAGPLDDRHIPTFEPDGGNEAWADVYAEQGQVAYSRPEPARRRDGQPWKPWKNGGSSRWQSRGSPVVQRPVPQAATPLDRIVWALISHSDFWEQLPSATQDLLCDQAAPYGEFFRWLDHTVLDHGPLPRDELTHLMTADSEDPGHVGEASHFKALARRVAHFHELPDDQDTVTSLINLIKPLELVALRDELDLLTQSGELSEIAEARKMELVRLTLALKLEISQHRPISG